MFIFLKINVILTLFKLVLALGQTRSDRFWSLNDKFKYLCGYLILNSN
jgi:hypothetical protein